MKMSQMFQFVYEITLISHNLYILGQPCATNEDKWGHKGHLPILKI